MPGGSAHCFDIKGYKFDSGPSLFFGLQSKGVQANPLAQVFQFFIHRSNIISNDPKRLWNFSKIFIPKDYEISVKYLRTKMKLRFDAK